jgi:hypothetical protein
MLRTLRLWLLAATAIALLAPAGAHAVAAVDPAGDTRGPLDLTEALLEQRDVRMSLRITTGGAWTHADLATGGGRLLCVTLAQGEPAVANARLCVASDDDRPALEYTALNADGTRRGETRRLAARVSHPSAGVLQASFLPVAAGLSVGPLTWSVQSSWSDTGECALVCVDLLPDGGGAPTEIGLLGVPRCFGAASRDPSKSCENPDLDRLVAPPPSKPKVLLDPYCDRQTHPELLSTCGFGAAANEADSTFALIGDSHASSMKTPLEVVTLGKRWRGISIIRATCPATRARPVLRTRQRARQCVRWNRQVLSWLSEHDEVDTVFLSAYAGAKVYRPGGKDTSMFETMRIGYRDEIRRLLRIVRRVVVIRDIPTAAGGHLGCVSNALKNREPVGAGCSERRGRALRRDPLVAGARAAGSSRVKVIDLSKHFCDNRRCFAVVGGALVHHDKTHMTTAFSATLGPFIMRALGD